MQPSIYSDGGRCYELVTCAAVVLRNCRLLPLSPPTAAKQLQGLAPSLPLNQNKQKSEQ